MKIEIWSDVVCPFCYIGDTKFEKALNQFVDKKSVEIEWKSYQLMPDLVTQPGKSSSQALAEAKGVSTEQARQMDAQATQIARQAGLQFNLDKAILANTFRAHQFLHFAKANGKQAEAEHLLFRSYFTDGKNVDNVDTLLQLGTSLGLEATALKSALENETYAGAVRADIREAQQIGVRGVPFFVFDRKYAVSGAQDPTAFLEVLEKSFAEWRKTNPEVQMEIIEGSVCNPDGKCN